MSGNSLVRRFVIASAAPALLALSAGCIQIIKQEPAKEEPKKEIPKQEDPKKTDSTYPKTDSTAPKTGSNVM